MGKCEVCTEKKTPEPVPFVAYELEMARSERNIKRLWIALIVAVALMFASNMAWLCAWMQYDYTSEEIIVEQDAQDGGNANYIGNDGDIVNGLPESNYSETETNP